MDSETRKFLEQLAEELTKDYIYSQKIRAENTGAGFPPIDISEQIRFEVGVAIQSALSDETELEKAQEKIVKACKDKAKSN